jgi:hypothetical protein
MARYKVTKVYVIEAASKDEAFAVLRRGGSEQLEYISIQEVSEPKKGWTGELKGQLIGK